MMKHDGGAWNRRQTEKTYGSALHRGCCCNPGHRHRTSAQTCTALNVRIVRNRGGSWELKRKESLSEGKRQNKCTIVAHLTNKHCEQLTRTYYKLIDTYCIVCYVS